MASSSGSKVNNYPICVSCNNHESKFVVHDQRSVKIPVCNKFKHPIVGEPLPCQEARQDERFCGFEGRGYEKKEDKATVLTGDVINLKRD